ncbi:MAG TPA: PDZ domain-containing protein [Bryobacteraceae bacterium]|nr:PDZ domain-containing protein [Bryobacteraceae bacterium]
MKWFGGALLLVLLVPSIVRTAPPETRLLRQPDISKDAVVFVYAEDLWTVPRLGGEARRLTSHAGDELYPKFSPDGKWIAFTGEYDGNADVYVMPTEGGEPRRLTYHPANDQVLGWTPDSKKVLFRSNRASAPAATTKLFLVSIDGGLEEMLPVPRASLTSFSPDGQKVAYNPTSQEFRTWKRYRGGWNNYIGIYDLKNNAYQELPRSGALDQFPMWRGNAVYFISDRDGTMNLYRYDLGSKQTKKLTNYTEYDIKWPSAGADAIVYENGGLLYSYELASGKVSHIPITVSSDLTTARPEIKSVANMIRSIELSPTGVRGLVEARGDIFTIPAEHGSIRNLTDTPGVHEQNPVWSPDGKWIAYLSDRSGEFELYLRPQKGGDEIRITNDGDSYRYGPKWSPDSKKLAYWDKKYRLYYIDIDAKQPVLVDQAEYGLEGAPAWAPDSRWLTYAKNEQNQAAAIFLYSLDKSQVTRVTEDFYNNINPVFDQNGKYLYFLSDRFFYPSSGELDRRFNYYDTRGIFALVLKADEASPFAPQIDDEKDASEAKKPDTDAKSDTKDQPKAEAKADESKSSDEKTAEKKPDVKPIAIDLDGLGARIVQVPVPAGMYGHLEARKNVIFYTSRPIESTEADRPGPPVGATLHMFDIAKRDDKVVLTGISNYDLDRDGKKVIYSAGPGNFGIIDAAPGKKVGDGKLDLSSLQARVDPRAEWKEIFHEAWRVERDFYWDPAMEGLDWKAIGNRYESLLPWVAHRSDLNYVIGEMIAELSTSHTYVQGGDLPARPRIGTGLLGVDFALDNGYYKLAKIYRGENWDESTRSPLTEPGLKVKEGDYLIAVNGGAVRAPANPYSFFENLAGKIVTLKINDKPSDDGAWEITVKTVASETGLRYHDWVESRRKTVSDATGGRIAYMHVPDTAIPGLQAFDKYFTAQIGKEGLIIDERYNGGGFVPDFFTEKLQRRWLASISPREGKDQPVPEAAIFGPKVMIVNELAGSGGDAFPWFFQQEKIGPVVGTRTWGGLVGISRNIPLMDGGSVTAPEVAFWAPDKGGHWIVENHGVDPDVVVEQRPDLEVAGHDPQLEKAIELAKQALDKEPKPPARPKYPRQTTSTGSAAVAGSK